MNSETLTLVITIASSALITLIVFVIYSNMKQARYDKDNNRALFESMRKSFETQIYSLNDKLVRNEERWRDINHLLIRKEYINEATEPNYNPKITLNNFLKSNGITNEDMIIDKRLVFVLTPFHPEFEIDYSIVKDTCMDVGLKCVRGDEEYFSSDIFSEMLRYIVKANLIIANINGRNANVLYELGIAQALDKPVILISREPENLPIDIKSKRFLIYKSYGDLQENLRTELIKALTR
ncbi:hypothetical protein LNQ49_22990 [Flavobacterium sp. F-65]|uniref:Nucleoside 2-deoxyribosyltransferase n=1 Tax=Flavobacterium pisciphilum TaxID=2893755 RepID=A0ABS8N316_9FLAO|nr:hypothetical protein [Flavobacterium sp. F-65]MCC9074460.1 hypothetical protein [Flavobacterium sp. F-65]